MKNTNPFEINADPSKVENYPTYRKGEVTTYTFEDDDLHLCYGVDASGGVWDVDCINYDAMTVTRFDGKLSRTDLKAARKLVDTLKDRFDSSLSEV